MAGDRYPGSLPPAVERRLQALEQRIRSMEKNAATTTTQLTRRTIVAEQDIESTSDSLAAHESASDPHPQYLTETEADLLYDELGAADAAVAAHEAEADPHSQYLTEAEADALYDEIGAAAAAVAAHEAEADPHPQYLTEAEGDVLYSTAALDDTDINGGVADSHYLGLYADGGATYDEPLTEGVADGGGA